MTNVYLYGHIGRRFGHRWQLEVSSPAEAIRGIMANRPDFQRYVTQHSVPGYRVFVGQDPLPGAHALGYPVGQQAIKIVPVVSGAAKSPVIGIIIGAVLVVAAVVTLQPELIGPAFTAFVGTSAVVTNIAVTAGFIGAGLIVSGVSSLLAGRNPAILDERPENTPSAFFSGPVNTTTQGHPVPVGYGWMRVGSAVISAGITTVDVAVK